MLVIPVGVLWKGEGGRTLSMSPDWTIWRDLTAKQKRAEDGAPCKGSGVNP